MSGCGGSGDGRGQRWAVHREQRRRHILDAAVAVVERTSEGQEVHVRQIAQEAGLGRAVIYRHFADRADLDHAIQRHVLQLLVDRLVPELRLTGTIEQTIDRIVRSYVAWAAEHPALHRLGAAETPGSGRPDAVVETIGVIADLISTLVTSGADLLEVELTEEDRVLLRPLVFGIVGQAVGTIRFWLAEPEQGPPVEVLADHLARSVWFQLDGHARDRGIELEPDISLDRIFSRFDRENVRSQG